MCRTSFPFAVVIALAAAVFTANARHSDQAPTTPPAPPTAPPATVPPAAAPPAKKPSAKMRVKDVKEVTGTITTAGREVRFELLVHKAPTLCANFAFLAKRGFWDGQTWSGFTRVIRQAGPNAIGYTLPREFAPDLTFDDPAGGLLCMAKISDKISDSANATRFFITIKNQERWNLDFQIFGKVTAGLDAIAGLSEGMTIDKVTVDGDVDALLKVFEPEIAEWTTQLQAMKDAHQLPPGTLPGTPDRRNGEVLPNRPIEGTPGDAPAK